MNPRPQALYPKRALGAVLTLMVAAALPACAADQADGKKGDTQAVAEVAGKTITMAELEETLAPQLAQIDRQRRGLLEQGLERLVEDRILAAEAEARGMSVDALVQAEIEAKAGEVTDDQANAFYAENQARINRPIAEILPQIKQYLGQQRREELRQSLVSNLRAKHKARILLDVDRVAVETAGSPATGPVDAPVTIVEFSDFECPFCSRVLPVIAEAERAYPGQLRVVFRQFPLNIHPNAPKAAEASLCANDQGKFWELHDVLFANQRALGVDLLKGYAAGLGLDKAAFDSCLDGGKYAAQVALDLADGIKAGVTGTPAMFVNGRFLNGAVPFETLAKLIDDELGRKGIAPARAAATATE